MKVELLTDRDSSAQQEHERLLKVEDEIRSLYSCGNFTSAIKLAEAASRELQVGRARLMFAAACLRSRVADYQGAVERLRDGIQVGLWWPAEWLETDPDLTPLRGNSEWKGIVAECERLRLCEQLRSRPRLFVRMPSNESVDDNLPCVFAIHWRGDNAREFGDAWRALTEHGYVLVLAQSSQVFGPNSYCWDNSDLAEREVLEMWESLQQFVPCDPRRTYVAGVSQGGTLALRLLAQLKPAACVAIVPWLIDLPSLNASLSDVNHRNVRGAIWTGTDDPGCGDAKVLHRTMSAKGFDWELIVEDGLGHALPPDFDRKLPALLSRLGCSLAED